jgi:hypothetical protein
LAEHNAGKYRPSSGSQYLITRTHPEKIRAGKINLTQNTRSQAWTLVKTGDI